VVVEFAGSEPNAGTSSGCAASPANGLAALTQAGFALTSEAPAVVCAIDSAPQLGCKDRSADAFWSYWHMAHGTDQWQQSGTAPDQRTPQPGSIDGWVYQSHASSGLTPPAPRSAIDPTTSPSGTTSQTSATTPPTSPTVGVPTNPTVAGTSGVHRPIGHGFVQPRLGAGSVDPRRRQHQPGARLMANGSRAAAGPNVGSATALADSVAVPGSVPPPPSALPSNVALLAATGQAAELSRDTAPGATGSRGSTGLIWPTAAGVAAMLVLAGGVGWQARRRRGHLSPPSP